MSDGDRNDRQRASLRRPARQAALDDDGSEEELAEDLTDAETEELAVLLRAMETDIQASLDQSVAGAKAVDLDQPIGRVSRIDAIQQQKMVQAQRSRLVVRLEQVRAAIAKIAEDEYGYCNRCDDPIGYPRLKSKPESPLCLGCQRELEKR